LETGIEKFNVRIYALIIDVNKRILLSDEVIRGQHFTKFPGGGLEYGEAPLDGLARECREEMDAEIKIIGHFHTTDKFVRSAFRPHEQVISIYYFTDLQSEIKGRTSEKKFDFDPNISGDQEVFRWADIRDLNPDDFKFLIDAEVVSLLKLKY
jgi:ADP-ribose pyrophosphatase YjhB (NUDIX family)